MSAEAPPVVRLKHAWRSSHPWIFQRLVDKPAARLKPGCIVDILGVDGAFIGRGFYNGHARIALRVLETDAAVPVDADWFARRIANAVRLRRDVLQLDAVSDAWRVVHSEGDGLSGLVVDRYADLLVLQLFSAGMHRYRDWIYAALRAQFPGCRLYAYADAHVQKQESFDFKAFSSEGEDAPASALITEHGLRFQATPGHGHKTGFFADQRDNRYWLAPFCAGRRVLDLCCNTGAFSIYAAAGGALEVTGIDLDAGALQTARANAQLNAVQPRFVQADILPWLRQATAAGEHFDVVILDPARMTRDREQVLPALQRYLEMNRLALAVAAPGALFATFSCTGLVEEAQFLDMLRRAAFQARRRLQVLKISGAGADHPFLADVPESRYLKAVFCRVD